MHLARSAIRSVLASTAASGSVRVVDDGNDDVDRLTFSQMEAGAALVPSEVANGDHAAEMLDVDHTAQALFGNDDVSDRAADAGVHSSCKQSRRRRLVSCAVYFLFPTLFGSTCNLLSDQ